MIISVYHVNPNYTIHNSSCFLLIQNCAHRKKIIILLQETKINEGNQGIGEAMLFPDQSKDDYGGCWEFHPLQVLLLLLSLGSPDSTSFSTALLISGLPPPPPPFTDPICFAYCSLHGMLSNLCDHQAYQLVPMLISLSAPLLLVLSFILQMEWSLTNLNSYLNLTLNPSLTQSFLCNPDLC